MHAQRISALALLVISSGYGVLALGLEDTSGLSSSRMSASSFPLALSALGILVSTFLLLRPSGPAIRVAGDRWRAPALVALTLVYAAGLDRLGFFLSTLLFLGAAQTLLGERRWSRLIGVPLAAALSSTLVLRVFLGVWLPEPMLRWLEGGP